MNKIKKKHYTIKQIKDFLAIEENLLNMLDKILEENILEKEWLEDNFLLSKALFYIWCKDMNSKCYFRSQRYEKVLKDLEKELKKDK